MGVYIKGMEMPKSCGDCPCGSVFSGYKCMAKQKKFEKYPLDSRQDWCPLVPVPPHGRLIDADELRWCYDNSGVADDVITKEDYDQLKVAVAVVRQTIDDAPTIIEAEEGKT